MERVFALILRLQGPWSNYHHVEWSHLPRNRPNLGQTGRRHAASEAYKRIVAEDRHFPFMYLCWAPTF